MLVLRLSSLVLRGAKLHRSTEVTINHFYLCIHQVQGLFPWISHILFWVIVHQDKKLLIMAWQAMETCQSEEKQLKVGGMSSWWSWWWKNEEEVSGQRPPEVLPRMPRGTLASIKEFLENNEYVSQSAYCACAQGPIQPGLGCLKGWSIHSFFGQPMPVPHYPLVEKFSSNI